MVKLGAALKEKVDTHFTFIQAPMEYVAQEVIVWGESDWWPASCKAKFIRTEPGEIRVGTKYKLKVGGSKGWDMVVSKINPKQFIERKFQTGILKGGYEFVKMEWRYNGVRVDYELHYLIKNPLVRLIWALFLKPQHDKNIKLILETMKNYVESKMYKKQEDEWENP